MSNNSSSRKFNYFFSRMAYSRKEPMGEGAVILRLHWPANDRDLIEIPARPYTADGVGPGYAPNEDERGSNDAKSCPGNVRADHFAENAAIEFLADFYGVAPWHLIAIGMRDIKAASFHGDNREGRAIEWIERWNNAGYNLYFCPNPLKKRGILKKASKDDVAAAEWLWSDIDPPKSATPEQVEQWRAGQLADYAAGLPNGLPTATFHIDSGRGFWRFWKLDEPITVDGKDGEQTALVESHGRGIEQAFATPADGCRNIDRIARLPGTINHKSKRRAVVLEYHPERVYQLADFPQARGPEPSPEPSSPKPDPDSDQKPFDFDALPSDLKQAIREGCYEKFKGDRSKAVFFVVCALIRAGVSEADILGVLLNPAFKISEHIYDKKSPEAYAKKQFKRAWDKGARPEPKRNLAEIEIFAGELARAVDDAEAALIKVKCPAMVRAEKLVRPIHANYQTSEKGVETEIVSLKPLTVHGLAYMINKDAATFVKYNGAAKKVVPIDPPEKVMATLLQKGQYNLPQVVGVISCPTLRPDGTILDQPGYDPATRLWHHLDKNFKMPPPPKHPTKKHALAALRLVQDLLSGYSLTTDLDRTVSIAAILSVVCRGAFTIGPMYLFNAFAAGEGKSHLVDLISHIVTGRPGPVITLSGNMEEDEKRLGALLLEGLPIVSLDNCTTNINSNLLCQIGSQRLIKVRILGKSEMPLCEWLGTMFVTGNNVIFVGDMTRRGLTANFNSNSENPESRKFDFDPIKRVLDDRGLYIAAILTMVRAYLLSGERVECPPIATYTDSGWSRIVRETLIWLGLPDVWACTEKARTEDPARKAARELVRLWNEYLGTEKSYRLHEIIEKANEREESEDNGWATNSGGYLCPELRDFLIEEVGDRNGFAIDKGRFGYWLRAIKGQIHEGHRIVAVEDRKHGNRWWLQAVG
jgi:hypothetical protein